MRKISKLLLGTTNHEFLNADSTLTEIIDAYAKQSRLRKFEQVDKWNFCLTTAIVAANRRDHEQTTAPEPYPGL
jgi:hypothetical protein